MAFQLTEQGKRSAEKIEEPRDPETTVIAFMYSIGTPVEMEEIQGRLRTNDEKTLRIMDRLKNTGFVEEV